MFFITVLLSLFVVISGCKSEEVAFGSADNAQLTAPPTGTSGHDGETPSLQPPVVTLVEKPQNHWLGESTQARFEVTVGDFPVSEVRCKVDGWPLPCLLTSLLIKLSGFDLGEHEVQVEAEDTEGLRGKSSARWLVSNNTHTVTESVQVEPAGNQADILFVIDNSISMEEEQAEMARRISHFFSRLRDLDWKVGIITTDPYALDPQTQVPNPFADGALLQFPNNSYWLDSSLSLNQARSFFSQTIQRDEEGNGHERGIRNTYRAIERSLQPEASPANQRLHAFFRDRASLSVVLISDENETLLDGVGKLLPEGFKSQGANLVDFVSQAWGSYKKFQYNSVVVLPGDYDCLGQYESFGDAYIELSQMTGGAVENICASDYTGALRNIAAGVINLQKVYSLQCEPFDSDGDGFGDFAVVKVSNSGAVPQYRLLGGKVEFERPLTPGSYTFEYSCLQNVSN